MFGLDAGTLEQKGQLLEAFLEQWGAKQGRRDVPTSRRWVNNTEVNNQKRRDIPTSRRQHGICTSSFKARMARNEGHREVYKRGQGIPEQSDANFEEVPVICTVSHFWILE